jgi:dTDP-4-dehydrorhamnose 3,5-epimerase
MNLAKTPLQGVLVAETNIRADARGTFTRLFCKEDLAASLNGRDILQINYSQTRQAGAVRGLHYQRPPHAEMKFIRCLRGAVWDVAVDLRAGSSTFLKWHAIELSPENARMLVVPEGCAHGFQTLAADSELLYLHTAAYEPEAEEGVAWNDPTIAVRWPLPLPEADGVSERDRQLAPLARDFAGVAP